MLDFFLMRVFPALHIPIVEVFRQRMLVMRPLARSAAAVGACIRLFLCALRNLSCTSFEVLNKRVWDQLCYVRSGLFSENNRRYPRPRPTEVTDRLFQALRPPVLAHKPFEPRKDSFFWPLEGMSTATTTMDSPGPITLGCGA